ncbi:MAG: ADOP family duplicated permease [Vicinamibacterales bacterium]
MSIEQAARPPRLAEWLLQRLLDDRSRDAVLGDLHEGYHTLRQARGAAAARRWYWTNAASSVIACRITGHREHESRRYDFDPSPRVSLRDLLRPAFRQFRDQPLYSGVSAGTLALAIGVACVSLTLVRHAFINPLPYRAGDELVSLLTVIDGNTSPVSPHVVEDLRASSPPLTEFAVIRPVGGTYASKAATESINLQAVTTDYFGLLGVSPSLGRVWTPQEPDSAVISGAFWRDQLAQDPNVIGSAIIIDGRPRTVVGVMPSAFMPPYFTNTAAWVPIDMAPLLADIRTRRTLTVLARRAPQATAQDVDAFLAVFSRQEQERFPEMHAGQTWTAHSLRDELVGASQPALVATAAAAMLLLLIVATNIAGLATAQAVSARHQLAVRAALGATRGRLFAEQLIESVTLAAAGSLAGVAIAFGLTAVIRRYQQVFLPRLAPLELDGATVAIGVGIGLAIGVVAALLPRSVVTAGPAGVLRSSRSSAGDVRATATRTGLVVAQVAIALVLLVGAGLLVRTVQHLAQRQLGFDSEGLTWFQVNLPGRKYQSRDAQLQFERDVLERVGQIPGVQSATASVGFPLWGGMMAGLFMKGDTAARREIAYLSVSPGFVEGVGARIVAGRDILPTDRFDSPRVAVINETMARQAFPAGDAIGAEVKIGAGDPNDRWITIVGIMADMRGHGVAAPIRPTAFGSTLQYSWPRRHIGVRTAGDRPAMLAAALRSSVHAVDPAVAVGAVVTAEQALADGMARHRLVMLALAVFGGLALVLCLSGLYAVVVLNSQQRRREFAIRVALGAQRGGVRWMVVRQALLLGGTGAAAGLLVAGLGTRLLEGLLQGVAPLDPATFLVATVALLALATLAAWQPASRAEKVDPVEALRAE